MTATDAPAEEIAATSPRKKGYEGQKQGSSDDFQTPEYALTPLYPFLSFRHRIWDPAAGQGNIVRAFTKNGFNCEGSDKHDLPGASWTADFLTGEHTADVIVTNPPFSLKEEFIARCYWYERPFALLLPYTALETPGRQELFERYGVKLILMDKRIDFETPSGEGTGAWFPTAWFTWGVIHKGGDLHYAKIDKPTKRKIADGGLFGENNG